jgi:hypothetical protein
MAAIADALSKGIEAGVNANPEGAAISASVQIVKDDPARLAPFVLGPLAGALMIFVIIAMLIFSKSRTWIAIFGFGAVATLVGIGIYGLMRRPSHPK